MKLRTVISILVASTLAFTAMSSVSAQGKYGDAAANRSQQVDRDRTYDRDRMSDRDRTYDRDRTQDRDRIDVPDQDRDRTRDRTDTPEQDRDRDRIHDPANLRDQDIYGNEFMSPAECDLYRNELGNAKTQEARREFQAQHEGMMQQRAMKQAQDLVPPGQGPVYGGEFMSVQERNEFREQLRLFDSETERQQFQARHREQMNERARALGHEVEEAE